MKAVYPGTFDPITMGHKDLIIRAAKMFDELVVGVALNPQKSPLFSLDRRVHLIEVVTINMKNVIVKHFDGLLVDFAMSQGTNIILKGIRAMTDFESEFQMAQINQNLNKNIQTLFLVTNQKYSFLSSSAVKEVAMNKGSISSLVPDEVHDEIVDCFKNGIF
ncbi:MAG: pantetheine-phosphate adenylyltransferase [Omnitrophica WOR_2 bacterium RBG_13_44_8]|nr:MAG: pantetheine-phosphate adenylyltransferase [Omnitrophica WOR_2 bacterium RBG_13_44_8]